MDTFLFCYFFPGFLLMLPIFWLWPKSICCFSEHTLSFTNITRYENHYFCRIGVTDKTNKEMTFHAMHFGEEIHNAVAVDKFPDGAVFFYGNTVVAYGNKNDMVFPIKDFDELWKYDYSIPSIFMFPPFGGFLLSLIVSSLLANDAEYRYYGPILSWEFFLLFAVCSMSFLLCKRIIYLHTRNKIINTVNSFARSTEEGE